MDVEKMAEAVFVNVRDWVERALQPILDRVKAIESRPAPERGDKGEPGKDGEPGTDGKCVSLEEVSASFERRFSDLSLQWERQAAALFDKAIERIPKPADGKDGRDGVDGLGFEDMDAEFDGERTVTLRWVRGDVVKEHTLTLPVVVDRGFWKDGTKAQKGDGLTCGGSYWIAQKDTDTKPETGNPNWRLAVKKGRDGRDGDKGDRGPPGEKGLPGLNGKNLA